jgi:hypothetical protein
MNEQAFVEAMKNPEVLKILNKYTENVMADMDKAIKREHYRLLHGVYPPDRPEMGESGINLVVSGDRMNTNAVDPTPGNRWSDPDPYTYTLGYDPASTAVTLGDLVSTAKRRLIEEAQERLGLQDASEAMGALATAYHASTRARGVDKRAWGNRSQKRAYYKSLRRRGRGITR